MGVLEVISFLQTLLTMGCLQSRPAEPQRASPAASWIRLPDVLRELRSLLNSHLANSADLNRSTEILLSVILDLLFVIGDILETRDPFEEPPGPPETFNNRASPEDNPRRLYSRIRPTRPLYPPIPASFLNLPSPPLD